MANDRFLITRSVLLTGPTAQNNLEWHATREQAERALAIVNAHEEHNGRGPNYWKIVDRAEVAKAALDRAIDEYNVLYRELRNAPEGVGYFDPRRERLRHLSCKAEEAQLAYARLSHD